jgi:hypothetical protein
MSRRHYGALSWRSRVKCEDLRSGLEYEIPEFTFADHPTDLPDGEGRKQRDEHDCPNAQHTFRGSAPIWGAFRNGLAVWSSFLVLPARGAAKAAIVAEVEQLHWRIWNGKAKNAGKSIDRSRTVMHHFQCEPGSRKSIAPSRKLWTALQALDGYLTARATGWSITPNAIVADCALEL